MCPLGLGLEVETDFSESASGVLSRQILFEWLAPQIQDLHGFFICPLRPTEITNVKNRLFTFACVVAAIGFVSAFAFALNSPTSHTDQVLAPFEFRREAAHTAEIAAQSLFLGVATSSPKDFVQHLLLGVCNNEIDTLQRFAESLHATQFSHDGETFTYYDLRDQPRDPVTERSRMINPKKPLRVMNRAAFDVADPDVKALHFEMASTYYGNRFVCVEVAGEGWDGREYRTRVVVAEVGDGWYAMPRCRSSKSFYKIADAMSLGRADAK